VDAIARYDLGTKALGCSCEAFLGIKSETAGFVSNNNANKKMTKKTKALLLFWREEWSEAFNFHLQSKDQKDVSLENSL